MKLVHIAPHENLRQLVKQYWVMEFDNHVQQREEILFPVGAIEIIFHLKQPLLRLHNAVWIDEDKAFIEGQQSSTITIKKPTSVKTIGITLYPWATHFFFSASPQNFTNMRFAIADVHLLLQLLHQQLHATACDEEIADLCDQCFIKLAKNNFRFYRHSEESIIGAFKKVCESNMAGIKSDWPYSSKLFEIKFKELVGMPASELIRKKRMANSLKVMVKDPGRSFTDICHSEGYYDQSHFIKDFRYYFNASPRSFQKEQDMLKHFIV